MHHELVVASDAAAAARAAATRIAEEARRAVAAHGAFSLAVSGGRTPQAMFADLLDEQLPWVETSIFQVDERIAPAGDPQRNLTSLEGSLGPTVPVAICPMPVNDADLVAAAARYAGALPTVIDVIQLGLGPDGHTASLVPGDDVLDVADRRVAITATTYQGTKRMTLTYPALTHCGLLIWLVTGADKREALQQLLAGDLAIPAGRVVGPRSLVIADAAAAGS